MAEGVKLKRAAKETGIPRSTLQDYIRKGSLPDGLPIWPNQVSENLPADAAESVPDRAEECRIIRHPTNQPPQELQVPGPVPPYRDSSGRFLPGNPITANYTSAARKAKAMLADYAPFVAQTLINIFGLLPTDRPELILAFAKEILDRGLGKPVQAIDLKETHTYEEYRFFEAAIIAADADVIRSAAALAQRLESHARDARRASVPWQVEIIPPPGGALHNLVPGGGREVSETDNLDASSVRKE